MYLCKIVKYSADKKTNKAPSQLHEIETDKRSQYFVKKAFEIWILCLKVISSSTYPLHSKLVVLNILCFLDFSKLVLNSNDYAIRLKTQRFVLFFRYDFNDTTSSPVTTPNTTHCTSWPYWQRPMYTKFRIYNNVSSVTKEFLVNVERPVHNFTTLSISGGPENTTEAMVLVLTEKTGDFFNCSWTIKDTTTVIKNSTYNDFLNGIHVKHQFATTGIFDVSVFCFNRLYSASKTINVSSYIPVSEFEASVLYGGACGAKKSAGDKGDGPGILYAIFVRFDFPSPNSYL